MRRRPRKEPVKAQVVWPTPTVADFATWSTETLFNHLVLLTRREQRLAQELEAVRDQVATINMLLDADHAGRGVA